MLLIGLAVLCAVALAIAFQLNTVNGSLRRQFAIKEQEFVTEKQNLNKQLSSLADTKKRLDAELGDLRAKFDALTKERDALNGKFDLVTKERASLVEKIQDLAGEKKTLADEIVELKKKEAKSPASYAAPVQPSGEAVSGDDAYWANILKEKAALEIQVKNLNTQLSDVQLKTEKAMEEGRKLELELKTVTEARGDLERRLVYNEKLADSLSEDLVREKRDKKAVITQMENLRQENFELKSRLMALGDKKTSLETKLVDLQQEREILAKRLSELDHILQERVDDIIQVKDDLKTVRSQAKEASAKDSRVVSLEPIVVKAQQESSRKSRSLSGQILAVNEENNFVIVDLGEDDGVKVGATFSVYRNMLKVATIEIIQTRKEISAADIKQVSSGAQIKIGDMVS